MIRPFTLTTAAITLTFDSVSQTFTLSGKTCGRLLFTASPFLLRPTFDGQTVELSLDAVESNSQTEAVLRFTGPNIEEFTLHIRASERDDAFDLHCEFRVQEATQLNRLELFPPQTVLNLYDVVNFRNRHHTPATFPELLLGGDDFKTNTYSSDWQFAPHPALMLFRKLETTLFVGALDLPHAFGMVLEAAESRVATWHLDYGVAPFGQPLQAGETFVSPRIRLFVREGKSVYDMLDEYGAMLVREGLIPDPGHKTRHDWWRGPLYCTWIDQCLRADVEMPADLQEQATSSEFQATRAIFNEAMVREAVAIIRRERLPFRTILLDEGWHVARGQWEPHPQRFPDLRRLVDELHAEGFKVVAWWNWAEIEDSAEVAPAHLMAGGKRNKHGARVRDYSLPATQDYLRKLFYTLFSSDPGCYDLDGIKTDFLADKVHFDMPVANLEWRGEENYFRHVTRLFYEEMKRHKPDAVHIGCAGHFYLAEWIDINRTYDVFGGDYREHEERGRMLRHTTPGCPVAYDFHAVLENLDGYFASAQREGASVQIGNVLYCRDDPFSSPRPADAAYYDLLRGNL